MSKPTYSMHVTKYNIGNTIGAVSGGMTRDGGQAVGGGLYRWDLCVCLLCICLCVFVCLCLCGGFRRRTASIAARGS